MSADGGPPGDRRRTPATAAVTLSEVAARAGVSVSAVSKVLRGTTAVRVSPETRQRIVAAAEELRYRPNFAARALQAARTQVLGLVVPDLTNAVFTELMHGVEDGAAAHGYTVLLGRLDTDRPQAEVIARLLGEGRVDGLVLQATDGVDPAGLGQLLDPRAAVVLINSTATGRASSVTADDVGGGRTATEHLIGLGHTRIALAGGLPTSYTAQRRRRGHQEAMRAAGLDPRADHETALGYTADQGRQALRQLMQLDPGPTAVVVANVNAAVGLLAEARASGIEVPRDLSVATVLDSWTAENTWPPLTAVRMQFYAMGQTAVTSVVRRIEDAAMADEVILDPAPELVVRESTAPPSS